MAGGNKVGVLGKTVGAPSVGDKKEIDYVQTTIGQGTWGAVPGGAEAGKAAGLLGVSALGRGANTRTVWY